MGLIVEMLLCCRVIKKQKVFEKNTRVGKENGSTQLHMMMKAKIINLELSFFFHRS
jgi:hypothetical protein